MSGRIESNVRDGTVRFFCRSNGHGFIDPSPAAATSPSSPSDDPVFMHISDIEGEFIPRKGDRVRFRVCPMPPKFDRFQAVHIEIRDFTPEKHHRWTEKETEEEFREDEAAMEEERKMNESLGDKPHVNV